jgi:uncharacterized tellurite resistance protein B-like protein
MGFLQNIVNRASSPHEAALTTAVAALTLSGDFTDLERRIISLFRDQFPPLSDVEEEAFEKTLENAIQLVREKGVTSDTLNFIQTFVAPAIPDRQDRLALYRYVYALAMANLNVDSGEGALLQQMQPALGLDPYEITRVQQDAINEFKNLHNALAAAVLGLLVVTADGRVQEDELEAIRSNRALLEPLGKLDDMQFQLVYDLSLSIHDRFLLDAANRADFLRNVIAPALNTPALKTQAFHYAASVTTSDSDLSQAEVDTLKELLSSLGMGDAEGEAIFNHYMTRVRTIDGRPFTG